MQIFAIFGSLLLIAFFSGIEIAFVSANKLRIELLKEKGSTRARIISEFVAQPTKFISTMLIGLNIGLVIFGSLVASYLNQDFFIQHYNYYPSNAALLVIQTIITTFIILIFGELIPKILFRVNSDQALLIFAIPAKYLFYIPLKPLSGIFHRISRFLIKRVAGADLVESEQTFTKEDLEYLVKETAVSDEDGNDESDHLNTEIFERALYLKDVKVRSCMVPRPEVQGIELSDGIEELKRMFIESKLSRIIVYEESIDRILGYVHHLDLLKDPIALRPIIRQMPVIPESMTARDLMLQFIRDKRNIAWVVDEYGGTSGIITLEDLMEEIFGEIQDEHDEESLTEKRVGDNEFLFSGRIEVDYLNEKYELNIPDGEYTTLSGYIINGFEDIPEAGTYLDLDNFHIKIVKATDKRIELVKIKLKQDPLD